MIGIGSWDTKNKYWFNPKTSFKPIINIFVKSEKRICFGKYLIFLQNETEDGRYVIVLKMDFY